MPRRRKPAIVIVSLIDILAILLIFFIVTTTFRKDQPQVKINLPDSTTAEDAPAETEPVLVSVTADGSVSAGGTVIEVDELSDFIATTLQMGEGRPFALQADRQAPFGVVIRVMDAFKENGIKNIPAFTRKGTRAGSE